MQHQHSTSGIIIQDARLTIEKKVIFDNINCKINPGSFTCLLGPSGVGKSTLLRMVANLDHDPTLRYQGRIADDNGQSLKDQVAYMAQSDGLLPWLSSLDNALLGKRLRGKVTQQHRQAARNLLAEFGLGDAIDKKPHQLSGGMKQRLALARTLLDDKPVIVMDEPFSALDVITRLKLQTLTAEYVKDKTVLMVTHDPLEALRLSDSIYVMHGAPATLGEAIKPMGQSPRDINNPAILALQATLLTQLSHDNAVAA